MPVPEPMWSDGLLEAGMGDPALARLMGWQSRVARMVDVEAALGRALASVGRIPPEAADAIARICDPENLDLASLATAAATSPTPVIPLVRALTDDAEPAAAAYLHHGATSQDVIDTATVLQLRDALAHLESTLLAVGDTCSELAGTHGGAVAAGRTLGQHAVPVTFGLRAARWMGALDRRIEHLRWLRDRLLVAQLGGAAGTSAVYGDHGLEVLRSFAKELKLGVPDLPWHADRDRIVELAGCLSAIASTAGSIALDLVLLGQPEMGELAERPAGAGSSAMPHKRNPVHATAARAAAELAQGDLATLMRVAGIQELERAAGGWQAEWVALPSAVVRTGGAVTRLAAALEHLDVAETRARENMDELGLTGSEALFHALAPTMGRAEAQALVSDLAAAVTDLGRPLREIASEDRRVTEMISPEEVERLLDPAAALQLVPALIERAQATHRRVRDGSDAA